MAFTHEAGRTATSIGRIEILLRDFPSETPAQTVLYQVQVIFSDGTDVQRAGNLAPHLTQTQINQLVAFMDSMRTKAVAEFIG